MDDATNDGRVAKLQAEALELVACLDREIAELRQLAPPGYEDAVSELVDTMRAIHEAIEELRRANRR